MLSSMFGLASSARLFLYEKGVLRSHRLERPVVSVGNLTIGGTGKTPVVGLLAKLLLEAGYRPSILTRGYRGKGEAAGALISDGSAILCGPEVAGDEAYLLATQTPGAVVAVGKNRRDSGRTIERRFRNVVHLLDDGFQHLRLYRDLDLLLIDASRPLEDLRLLPAGSLREPLTSSSRADAILLTRSHLVRGDQLRRYEQAIGRLNPQAPVFRFFHEASAPVEITTGDEKQMDELQNRPVLALAAIGNPEQFLADLDRLAYRAQRKLIFRDHHCFSQADLEHILAICEKENLKAIITTEKDAVRLKQLSLPADRFFALPIAARCQDEKVFREWFHERIAQMA